MLCTLDITVSYKTFLVRVAEKNTSNDFQLLTQRKTFVISSLSPRLLLPAYISTWFNGFMSGKLCELL